jgi:hypothetical protein
MHPVCRPGQASVSERDPGPITTGSSCYNGRGHSELDNRTLWLWVPASQGTTERHSAAVVSGALAPLP